jgi:hypothetical protein
VAGILVARHLETADDLFDSKGPPRTKSLVAAAVQWAEGSMRKIDNVEGFLVGHQPVGPRLNPGNVRRPLTTRWSWPALVGVTHRVALWGPKPPENEA